MFRKTIQQTQRTALTNNFPSQQQSNYNTERQDRYQQESKQQNQRKTPVNGQFGQLKKAQQTKTSELVIRQCDINQLNTYKKPTSALLIRPQTDDSYYISNNSSNKKQRHSHIINPQRKTYDSGYKEPLEEIQFSERQNIKALQPSSHFSQYYDQQLETIKQYMFQLYQEQEISIKSLKQNVKSIQLECMGELENFANQISRELNKQKDDMIGINKRGIETQRELRHFRDSFNDFVKDNQEKIQSIFLEMNGAAGNKKSRTGDEFGVELKSSTHCISGGVGTSMSVNFQNQNIGMKLYNEMSGQLEVVKAELQICKEKILLLQKDTKILQSQKKNNEFQKINQNENIPKLNLQEVQKLIIEKFSEERKKNAFSEKIQQLDLKTKDLYKVYQDMDSNIKGMNAEFTRVINGTVIKKQKMLEAKTNNLEEKLNELNQKLTQPSINQLLRPQVHKILQQKSGYTKIIKIRECSGQQKVKLCVTKENPQFTYMLDEEGYLLDFCGQYIVETQQSGERQRIKIQKNLLYLLETQGLDIK